MTSRSQADQQTSWTVVVSVVIELFPSVVAAIKHESKTKELQKILRLKDNLKLLGHINQP